MRILFSAVGGEGHVQPLLPLAVACAGRGHDVAVVAAASLAGVVTGAGLAHLPARPDVVPQYLELVPVDVDRDRQDVRRSFAGWMAAEHGADLLELARGRRPDLIVRDEMDFGAPAVAELLGVPDATVLVLAAGGLAPDNLIAEPLARLRAGYGLPPDPPLDSLRRNLVLSPFPPSFRDPLHPLPVTAHGYRASGRHPAGEPPVKRVRPGAPLVYVTLGTIFNTESGDLFARLLTGLAGLDVEVVLTTGRAFDPDGLGPLPEHVHAVRYLPQAEVLPHADLVVNHAGSGSVTAALAHGLPMVCVPMGADQPLNGARCRALGVAEVLDPLAITPADVSAAAARVLTDPGFRTAAERLAAELAALPEPDEVVTRLEAVARG